VTTAAVKTTGSSVVEEDIIFLFRPAAVSATARGSAGRTSVDSSARSSALSAIFNNLRAPIALRFVEQPQSLHQQTLSIELRGFLIGLALKVEFEVPAGPAQNFEDSLISQ